MDTASRQAAAVIWRERIAAQRDSGLSIRAWCRDNGYGEHLFYSWRAKLGLRPHKMVAGRALGAVAAPLDSIPFTEVMIGAAAQPPVASEAQPLCLKLAGGRELVLPSSMPLEQVAKLLRLVEGQP
jgi:hypothetical protein